VARPPSIPTAPLIAAGAFGPRLSASRVAEAIAQGVRAGGVSEVDVCPLDVEQTRAGDLRALLAELHFDARMHRARALIVAQERLDERTLQGSVAFEIATRARQAGVPAYAVTAQNRLNSFDERVLDLQLVLVAASARALAAAGGQLARVL
jgi:glycerate kinase